MTRQAEIIAIGNEILGGHTIDTNSSWLASQLKDCGVLVRRKQVVRDSREDVLLALSQIHDSTEFIFISGGLGPTRDDITKEIIAEYFSDSLEFNEDIYQDLKSRYGHRGQDFLDKNRNQAIFPKNATRIFNDLGSASGISYTRDGKQYFVMPGVPAELKGMCQVRIFPMICDSSHDGYSEVTLRTTGIPESELAARIETVFQDYDSVNIGYYPSYSGVDLRLGEEGDGPHLDELVNALTAVLGDFIYAEGTTDMVEVVSRMMTSDNLSLALAESCTGGYVAHRITSCAGASAYLREGLVVYSNDAKIKRLGVNPETLDKYGAVSRETVLEMLRGLHRSSGAQICAAVSGIAGPEGGSPEKPVGTVWLGVSDGQKELCVQKHFSQDRTRNIHLSAQALLDLVRLLLADSRQLDEHNSYWK